jgi:hypothetical protein
MIGYCLIPVPKSKPVQTALESVVRVFGLEPVDQISYKTVIEGIYNTVVKLVNQFLFTVLDC